MTTVEVEQAIWAEERRLVEWGVRLIQESEQLEAIEAARTVMANVSPALLVELAIWKMADRIQSDIRTEALIAERNAERWAVEAAREKAEVEPLLDGDGRCPVCRKRHTSVRTMGPCLSKLRQREAIEKDARQQGTDEAALRDQLYRDDWSRMAKLVAGFADKLRMEWTAELLSSPIAMPDGTRTTWGAATVEQHRARAAMFEANATANAQGAARHLLAVHELEAAGVDCLNDLVAVEK